VEDTNPVLRSPGSLARARSGEKVRVIAIEGGRGVQVRLREMGLHPGDVLEVIQNNGGPVIVQNGCFRIALGKGVSSKIVVGRSE